MGVEKSSSKVLMKATLKILSPDECLKTKLSQHLTPTMICAFTKGRDGCQVRYILTNKNAKVTCVCLFVLLFCTEIVRGPEHSPMSYFLYHISKMYEKIVKIYYALSDNTYPLLVATYVSK